MAEYWFDSHDGLRLYSRVYASAAADAPVVLCLHGLMRNSRDFGELAAHLAARHRVIVPDMRGRGLSARDPNFNNYQIPVYLQDVLTLLAGLGAARVTIIGTSMGGLMAMLLAATQPKLVSRIVLNDVGPEVDPRGLERIRGYAGRAAPVRSWAEAAAQVRADYGAAWPDLSDARWDEIARLSYRANAQGVPEVDADPLIREPLRDTSFSRNTPQISPIHEDDVRCAQRGMPQKQRVFIRKANVREKQCKQPCDESQHVSYPLCVTATSYFNGPGA